METESDIKKAGNAHVYRFESCGEYNPDHNSASASTLNITSCG